MKVKVNNVRLAFPKLFEPKAVGTGQDKYYAAAFPIEPGSANQKALDDALVAVANEKWGAKGPTILAAIREKGDLGFQHKPLRDKNGEVYDGFQDMFALNASLNAKKGKPGVFDKFADPATGKARAITDPNEGKPYAGCYVNVTIDLWAQDNQFGRKINAQLVAVQFWNDGDAFAGGGRPSADDFDAVTEGAGADALA